MFCYLQTYVFESEAKYDLIFTIVDYPPINLDEIGLPPESIIPIEVSPHDGWTNFINLFHFKSYNTWVSSSIWNYMTLDIY
jgi:hypothetical protein